ncbi:terminase large subunit [Corticicoccus populi]|uniref:Terminase large subunit n=1 Tax=Corticicoccus populi TaxID=1812821 RepID=A0ABW5WUY8_9STAP
MTVKNKSTKNPKGAGRKKLNHDYATEYAEKVVSGEITASKKNIQVAKRHLNDIKVQNVLNYQWKPEEANKVIKFIEMLPDPKTGIPLKLELFQKFILSSLIGWQDEEGYRRFKKAYISMSRKNGKTLIINGLAVYELMLGKYPTDQREILIAAKTLRQAQTLYKMAYRQLNLLKANSQTLRKQLEMRKTDIVHIPSDSSMRSVANNPDAVDSLNPCVSIIDEAAGLEDTEMYNRLKSGMSLQKNGLMVLISTASNKLNSLMYSEYKYITNLLNEKITNNNYFVYCAEQDSEDEIEDTELWVKSNPLLSNKTHHNTILKNIKQDIDEQRELGEEQGVLIKNFNMWQSESSSTYISDKSWQACSTDEVIDITGTDTVVGLDLSKVDDLTSVSFCHLIDKKKIYVDSHSFISTRTPLEVKMKRDKVDYLKMEQEGYATITKSESGVIDYTEVIEYILDYEKKRNLNIKAVMFDPYNIGTFEQAMKTYEEKHKIKIKWEFIEQSQQMYKLSPVIKNFRIGVWNKEIIHSNNPLLNYALNNAVAKEELNSNIRVQKKSRYTKIDPLAALFNAYGEAQHLAFKPMSINEKIKSGKFSL